MLFFQVPAQLSVFRCTTVASLLQQPAGLLLQEMRYIYSIRDSASPTTGGKVFNLTDDLMLNLFLFLNFLCPN